MHFHAFSTGSEEEHRHLRSELGGISPPQPAQMVLRWQFALETPLQPPLLQQSPLGVSSSSVPTATAAFAGLSISVCIADISLTGTRPRARVQPGGDVKASYLIQTAFETIKGKWL